MHSSIAINLVETLSIIDCLKHALALATTLIHHLTANSYKRLTEFSLRECSRSSNRLEEVLRNLDFDGLWKIEPGFSSSLF